MFLQKVLEVFKKKIDIDRQMIMALFSHYDQNKDGVLSLNEFTNLMNQCQPCPPLTEAQIMDLWIEVNDSEFDDDSDSITPEGFTNIITKKNIQLPYWKQKSLKCVKLQLN